MTRPIAISKDPKFAENVVDAVRLLDRPARERDRLSRRNRDRARARASMPRDVGTEGVKEVQYVAVGVPCVLSMVGRAGPVVQ